MSAASRFWAKVDKNGPVHPVLGTRCWLWTGCRSKGGYGRFLLNGKVEFAARALYALTGQPVPPSLRVCHHCDNPPCVNQAHTFVGTHGDNMRDMVAKGRYVNPNARKTHCPHGHEYTPENTFQSPGGRHCRECNRILCRTRSRRRAA